MSTQYGVSSGTLKKTAKGSGSSVVRVPLKLHVLGEDGRVSILTEEAAVTRLTMRRLEAARALGVSLGTLDTWIRRKLIPSIRMPPRVVLLRREDVLKALERFTIEARG
jgi:excisionase family DNA binding protein